MRTKRYKKFGDLKSLPASQVEFPDNFDFTGDFLKGRWILHLWNAWWLINAWIETNLKKSLDKTVKCLVNAPLKYLLVPEIIFGISAYGFKDIIRHCSCQNYQRESVRIFNSEQKRRELSWTEEEGHHVSIYTLFQSEISPTAERRGSVIKTTNIAPLQQCQPVN